MYTIVGFWCLVELIVQSLWLVGWPAVWLGAWLTGSPAGREVGPLAGIWMAGWPTGWLPDHPIGWLLGQLAGWLVVNRSAKEGGWLAACLAHWPAGHLYGWKPVKENAKALAKALAWQGRGTVRRTRESMSHIVSYLLSVLRMAQFVSHP